MPHLYQLQLRDKYFFILQRTSTRKFQKKKKIGNNGRVYPCSHILLLKFFGFSYYLSSCVIVYSSIIQCRNQLKLMQPSLAWILSLYQIDTKEPSTFSIFYFYILSLLNSINMRKLKPEKHWKTHRNDFRRNVIHFIINFTYGIDFVEEVLIHWVLKKGKFLVSPGGLTMGRDISIPKPCLPSLEVSCPRVPLSLHVTMQSHPLPLPLSILFFFTSFTLSSTTFDNSIDHLFVWVDTKIINILVTVKSTLL